jgi:RsiW-degrading membrane proteinase PrsW (M82 family)
MPGAGFGNGGDDAGGEDGMKQRTRKLMGTLGLLALIVVFCVVAGAIYANLLGDQPWWVLIVYFAIAGSLWFFPAAWMIRWMARPDPQ